MSDNRFTTWDQERERQIQQHLQRVGALAPLAEIRREAQVIDIRVARARRNRQHIFAIPTSEDGAATPSTRLRRRIPLTINIDPAEFFDQAVNLAVSQLLSQTSVDEDGDEHQFPNAFQTSVRKEIHAALSTAVASQAEVMVREMLSKPLPKVDMYGDIDRSGGTMTLAEKIGEEVRLQVVDRARNIDRTGRRGEASVLHKVIADEVDKVVTGELKAEIEEARKTIRERIKGKVASLLEAETFRAAGIR